MSVIDCTITWTDNSSGAQNETAQEVQIYTDSPSFVPNTPIDYSVAPHPWMSLPALASGVTTAAFTLELPVTYIKFRVRQLNADGPGSWDVAAGTRCGDRGPDRQQSSACAVRHNAGGDDAWSGRDSAAASAAASA